MPSWPATLPAAPRNSAELSSPDCLIRTTVATGPPKVRRRTSAAPTPWSMSWVFTTAQHNTFKTFWTTTLYHGSLSFTMTDPETGNSSSFRILSWTKRDAGNGLWEVSAGVEKLA